MSSEVKQRPGRKPKREAERADAKILVRATKDERRDIRKHADEAGCSLSRYLVACGLKERPPASADEREGLTRLSYELHKAGTNLNQIAHALNIARRGGGGAVSDKEVERAITEIRQTVAAVRERMKG